MKTKSMLLQTKQITSAGSMPTDSLLLKHTCVSAIYMETCLCNHTHTYNDGHNGDHAVLALCSIQCGQKHMEYVPNSAAGRMTTDSVLLPHTHTRVSAMATHSLHGIRKKLRNDRFNANRRPRAPPKNSSPRICAVARCCNACVVCCVCIPTTATGGLNHGFLAFATHMCVCYDIRISRKRNQCFCKQSKSPQPEACPQTHTPARTHAHTHTCLLWRHIRYTAWNPQETP